MQNFRKQHGNTQAPGAADWGVSLTAAARLWGAAAALLVLLAGCAGPGHKGEEVWHPDAVAQLSAPAPAPEVLPASSGKSILIAEPAEHKPVKAQKQAKLSESELTPERTSQPQSKAALPVQAQTAAPTPPQESPSSRIGLLAVDDAGDDDDAQLLSLEGLQALGSGHASWYGPGLHGRLTANGERFDSQGFTAAHRTLPFGTRLCVRSQLTGKAVQVRINDRGPFVVGREIDLSQGAARALGMTGLGIKAVDLCQLTHPQAACSDRLPKITRKAGVHPSASAAPLARRPAPAPARAKAPAPRAQVKTKAAPRRR